MSQDKKKIVGVVASILAIVIIVGIAFWLTMQEKPKQRQPEEEQSKVAKLLDTLKQKQSYSIKTILDENNTFYYAKKDNRVRLDISQQGQVSTYIVKNGNSYLLLSDQKIYYTYLNNETNLGKIELSLENLKNSEYTKGKEKIEGQEFNYEEYNGITDFLLKGSSELKEQNAKTRFYFKADKLEYIKTIEGEYQELLRVETSYQVKDDQFEIPSDYQEA